MFKNPGKSLKVFAWIIVITVIIVFVAREAASGLVCELLGIDQSPFSILLAGVIGYLVGQTVGLLLYATGELVESATAIRKKLCGEKEEAKPDSEPVLPVDHGYYVPQRVQRQQDGRWMCPVCDCMNSGSVNQCANCATKVNVVK